MIFINMYANVSSFFALIIFLPFIIAFLLCALTWWPPLIFSCFRMITIKHFILFYSVTQSFNLNFKFKKTYVWLNQILKKCILLRFTVTQSSSLVSVSQMNTASAGFLHLYLTLRTWGYFEDSSPPVSVTTSSFGFSV